MRRLLAVLIVLALTGSSGAALGLASPGAAHGCCKARVEAAAHPCQTARLSCCEPAPQPDRQSTVPPAGGPLVPAPELLVLHHAAAILPDVTAAARAFALVAHAEGRFKSPPDPVYLRNAVLLV